MTDPISPSSDAGGESRESNRRLSASTPRFATGVARDLPAAESSDRAHLEPAGSSRRPDDGLGLWTWEYQFARRWYRRGFDHSARAFDGSLKDNGGSVFVTFWPTEFSQIRTQYRRTNFAERVSANELLFQLNFSIGAHGAHVF
jgi:hypothetical protein